MSKPLSPEESPPGRRVAALLLVGTAVALAAALVALRLHFQPPTVPPYAIVDRREDALLSRNDKFTINVHPETTVLGAIAARGFLLRGDEVRPWDPPFTVTIAGDVQISGPVDTLFAGIPRGAWDLALAIGRPEVLPTAPRDVLRARESAPSEAGWHLVRERVRLGE